MEVEPTTSVSEPERLSVIESVQRFQEPAVEPETVSTPLLLPSASPRTSRFTVPPPSGAYRRQSPRVRRGAPRKRETDQSLSEVVLSRNDRHSTTSKDTIKSSDTSSSNNNEPGVEPSALTPVSVGGGPIPEYVEFGAAVASTATAEVTAEPAAIAVGPGPAEFGPHEYCYTMAPAPGVLAAAAEIEAVAEESPPLPPSSTSSSRRPGGREPPAVEGSMETVARPRCLYCDEPFEPGSNRRGACPDAPDPSADCVDRASCLCCAHAVVYHCLEPVDDEAPSADDRDPCACDGGLDPARRCRRWTALSLLSLVAPCLCLYWPLTACHRCTVRVGCCGGRHSASSRVLVV